MNKINTFLLAISIMVATGINAQDTLVQWTFPTESAYADGGIIPANLDMIIETAGGTNPIEFKNGATSKAARATGWHEGADEKKWRVDLITTGYHNIQLSSRISSGGQNPGPRDWKVQYKADGNWTDVEGSEFVVGNDWETGSLVNLSLPQACADQATLKLRWIMTSDTAHDGSIVAETGISKIDDIFVTGEILDDINEKETVELDIYPNPASDILNIRSSEKITGTVLNNRGQIIDIVDVEGKARLDLNGLAPGLYIITAKTENDKLITKRFVIK